MKAIIYGKGKNIENQFAECLNYAMLAGIEKTETASTIPDVIQRISKRDINVVLVTSRNILADNDFEYDIVRSTFARYGTRIEITEL